MTLRYRTIAIGVYGGRGRACGNASAGRSGSVGERRDGTGSERHNAWSLSRRVPRPRAVRLLADIPARLRRPGRHGHRQSRQADSDEHLVSGADPGECDAHAVRRLCGAERPRRGAGAARFGGTTAHDRKAGRRLRAKRLRDRAYRLTTHHRVCQCRSRAGAISGDHCMGRASTLRRGRMRRSARDWRATVMS